MKPVEKVMRAAPDIPVLVIDDAAHAPGIAEALVAGGLPVLEVTLRTESALDVIREMARVDGAIVGAGTVLNPDDLARARDAGATFAVSPGLTKKLAKAADKTDIALLPGVANAGDIMRGLDMGLEHFKFFPAVANGGIPALKSLLGPLYRISICPTGGVTQATAADWLAIPQVLCVGGSWLVPAGDPDLAAIRASAEAAAGLSNVAS